MGRTPTGPARDRTHGACGVAAGLLAALPDGLLRAVFDVELPQPGAYAVAMCFLPRATGARGAAEQALEEGVTGAGARRSRRCAAARLGASLVVTAIADGRRCAAVVDTALQAPMGV